MIILVLNCGSSSLKYQLLDMKNDEVYDLLAKGLVERIGMETGCLKHQATGKEKFEKEMPIENHTVGIQAVMDALLDKEYGVLKTLEDIEAVGHRVVHGAEEFVCSQLITDEVVAQVEKCSVFAPLHNPANLLGIKAVSEVLPSVPQVGVFDTAFHQSMPAYAYMYGLPYEYYEKYGIRRYGFHGTSHKYVSAKGAKFAGLELENSKIITCHLGNGCSITAIKDGVCVDTSMGFTPLDGVEMGTRCGSIDPAIVPYIMKKYNIGVDEITDFMNKKCGFLGVSGYSSDSRDIEAAILGKFNDELPGAPKTDEEKAITTKHAQLAADILAFQVKKYIGSYSAIMNGLDAIVFTAGMGENNPELRDRVCRDMEFLGIDIDFELNAKTLRQLNTVELSTPKSKVKVYVLPTNEELVIARDTRDIVEAL